MAEYEASVLESSTKHAERNSLPSLGSATLAAEITRQGRKATSVTHRRMGTACSEGASASRISRALFAIPRCFAPRLRNKEERSA